MTAVKPIEFDGERLVLLDQRHLPVEELYRVYSRADAVAAAIRDMVVRGAPAIGITAAYALAMEARAVASGRVDVRGDFDAHLHESIARLQASRPTAVNLFWALGRLRRGLDESRGASEGARAERLHQEARAIHEEDAQHCLAMGRAGAALLGPEPTVLTHCNTGALATGGIGTALGVIRAAADSGRRVRVYAGETRPWLQGARLTAWELMRDGVDVTLMADSAAAWLMHSRTIDAVLVGADRIAANGDVANKIGTYALATAAQAHGVAFYVVAPTTTIDAATPDGAAIPIEERPADEVRQAQGTPIAPPDVPAYNPAFDVTPASLITAIITERGVFRPPYRF